MRKSIDNMKYAVLILTAMIASCGFFCTVQTAGGSEIGNPAVMAGVVADSLGKGVGGVSLYLIDADEDNPSKLHQDSCRKTLSGNNGEYRFTDVYEGTYNLYGVDSSGQRMLLEHVVVDVNNAAVADSGLLIVNDTGTLAEAGYVVIDTLKTPGADGIVYIPGTPIRAEADSAGEYILRCPQSVVDIGYYDADTVTVLVNDLEISSGRWVDLTGAKYIMPVPAIISGLISGASGLEYAFTAGSVYIGTNHPVEYRYDWGDSVSVWSLSVLSTHSWNVSGTFQVRVQARSARDTLSVSDWSVPVLVEIR